MSDRDLAISTLEWSHARLLDLIADFPADKALYQSAKTDNHLLWTLGHLAMTNEWFETQLTGAPGKLPESYGTLFGYQTKPNVDASGYPRLDEVRQNFDASHQRLLSTFKSLGEDGLKQSLKEKSGGFTSDPIDAMFKNAWHIGWHSGQIASLRKALSLKSIF